MLDKLVANPPPNISEGQFRFDPSHPPLASKQIAEELIDPIPEAMLAYNVRFDIKAYCNLLDQKSTHTHEEFIAKFNSLNALTRTNIETSIAERFNAEIHRASYKLKDGQLIHESYEQPFLEIIRRGQEFREKSGSQEIDRERAELAGFKKVQETLASEKLSNDAKVIVISPVGGIYGHNFYDLYQRTEDGKINMSRYSSKNSYQKFLAAARQIDPFCELPDNPSDADFLARPLITYLPPEQIQTLMDPDEKTMSQEELEKIKIAWAPAIGGYIVDLLKNPNTITQENYLDILRFAQAAKNGQTISAKDIRQIFLPRITTACGISGSPYSVADFITNPNLIQDRYGSLQIHCQECNTSYPRNFGKLEENCRYCGGTKGIVC